MSDLSEVQRALNLANRALRLLLQCNNAVIHATDEEELYSELCRMAVESAGYRMAWLGKPETDPAQTVRPIAYAGPGAKEWLDSIHVSWGDNAHGHGTAGNAIRSRRPAIGRDLLNNPNFAVWRGAFGTRDYASAIAIPLIVQGDIIAALLIYAAEADAFDSMEVNLLEELGKNISLGITALRAQKERSEALVAVERARNELEARVAQRTAELNQRNAQMVQEIELRKRAEETLRKSEEKYRVLVENANSIIMRMDLQGRVTFFNEFAQRFFGFREEEILGRNVVGTIVPETESSGRDLVRMIREIPLRPEKYVRNENENVKRNGERVWIAWANKPIYDTDGVQRETLCVGNDITDLKRAESELMRAKEAAESADRTKSAFLAAMSHELRTPLNSIIGFSGILLQCLPGPLNEEQKKQLTMVSGSAHHLLSLINEVLDISKIEAGQLEATSEPFDLRRSVEKVVKSVEPMAGKKQLSLQVSISSEVERMVGDQRRFEQILMNLLSNAIKFTDQGEVTVRCRIANRRVITSVQDTGIGISPEHRDEIFRPFQQLDSGLMRKHEGSGLGLSICKRLAELLGGSISFESQPGKGSTFTYTLPLGPGRTSHEP